jgi:hypothetical protein
MLPRPAHRPGGGGRFPILDLLDRSHRFQAEPRRTANLIGFPLVHGVGSKEEPQPGPGPVSPDCTAGPGLSGFGRGPNPASAGSNRVRAA